MSYDAKGGATSGWGARASQDLIVTRGKGFTKEKNKKKRGSYRGGEIDQSSQWVSPFCFLQKLEGQTSQLREKCETGR